VIFDVLIAVSGKRAVGLFLTPCRLIEIYHPFLFYKDVRGGRFLHLMVETEPGSSSKTFVSTTLHIPKDEILELKDSVQFSAACMGQSRLI